MKSKILLSFLLIAILSIMVNSVFAEQILESHTSNVPTPEVETSSVNREYAQYRQQQEETSIVFLITSLIISLIIGIITMVLMIKHSPKIPSLIIYGLIFLSTLIWFFSTIFTFDGDTIEGLPFFLLFLLSGYFTFGLIKIEKFANKMKYALSLSTGVIITSVLAILFSIVIGVIFRLDPLGTGLFAILIVAAGAIGSFILGIVGFVIDRFRR